MVLVTGLMGPWGSDDVGFVSVRRGIVISSFVRRTRVTRVAERYLGVGRNTVLSNEGGGDSVVGEALDLGDPQCLELEPGLRSVPGWAHGAHRHHG